MVAATKYFTFEKKQWLYQVYTMLQLRKSL